MSTYSSCGMNAGVISEVNKYVKDKHYHLACTRVFEVTHGMTAGEGLGNKETVTHPNRYAARSRELAAPTVKSEDVTMTDA